MWNLYVELREPEFSRVEPLCQTLGNLNFQKWTLYVEPWGTWTFKSGTFMWTFKSGTVMSHLGEPELSKVEPLCGTLGNPNFKSGIMRNLGEPEFLRVEPLRNLGEPGSRFRAAAPNHPEALLEEPQAFQAVGGKKLTRNNQWGITNHKPNKPWGNLFSIKIPSAKNKDLKKCENQSSWDPHIQSVFCLLGDNYVCFCKGLFPGASIQTHNEQAAGRHMMSQCVLAALSDIIKILGFKKLLFVWPLSNQHSVFEFEQAQYNENRSTGPLIPVHWQHKSSSFSHCFSAKPIVWTPSSPRPPRAAAIGEPRSQLQLPRQLGAQSHGRSGRSAGGRLWHRWFQRSCLSWLQWDQVSRSSSLQVHFKKIQENNLQLAGLEEFWSLLRSWCQRCVVVYLQEVDAGCSYASPDDHITPHLVARTPPPIYFSYNHLENAEHLEVKKQMLDQTIGNSCSVSCPGLHVSTVMDGGAGVRTSKPCQVKSHIFHRNKLMISLESTVEQTILTDVVQWFQSDMTSVHSFLRGDLVSIKEVGLPWIVSIILQNLFVGHCNSMQFLKTLPRTKSLRQEQLVVLALAFGLTLALCGRSPWLTWSLASEIWVFSGLLPSSKMSITQLITKNIPLKNSPGYGEKIGCYYHGISVATWWQNVGKGTQMNKPSKWSLGFSFLLMLLWHCSWKKVKNKTCQFSIGIGSLVLSVPLDSSKAFNSFSSSFLSLSWSNERHWPTHKALNGAKPLDSQASVAQCGNSVPSPLGRAFPEQRAIQPSPAANAGCYSSLTKHWVKKQRFKKPRNAATLWRFTILTSAGSIGQGAK